MTTHVLDKLVHAIQAERERDRGERLDDRLIFLDFDDATHFRYDLTAREAAGFLRLEKNQEALRQRLGAKSVKYRPSKYNRASGGGGGGRGFIRNYANPASRNPTSVIVKFGEATEPAHATKKTAAQLNREIAAALARPALTRAELAADKTAYLKAREESVRLQNPRAFKGTENDDKGVFYLADTQERPLGPEFRSQLAAKRAAMKLVRDGTHALVEVWHRWQGGRYLQGVAKKDGWSDV